MISKAFWGLSHTNNRYPESDTHVEIKDKTCSLGRVIVKFIDEAEKIKPRKNCCKGFASIRS